MTIRRGVVSDARAIATFQTACWREAYRGLVPQDYLDRVTEDDRGVRWRDRLDGLRQVWVAEQDGSLVGVMSSAPGADAGVPPLELNSLYVGAAYRGTGLAGRLVDVAVASRPAFLWVFQANVRAHRFYRRLGFEPDGRTAVDPDTGLGMDRYVRSLGGSD